MTPPEPPPATPEPPDGPGPDPVADPVAEPAAAPTDPSGGDRPDTGGTAEAAPTGPAAGPPGEHITEPAWWPWVRRHRRGIGAVAGLLVVALVGTLVLVRVLERQPLDVVRDYLDALRAGDTGAALEIAGEPAAADAQAFLDAGAMVEDWTVTGVVERNRRENDADVDVTIRAGEVSEQGRFHLVRENDVWTIQAPFVRVNLAVAGMDHVELGGLRRQVPAGANQPGTVPLLLFPGAYAFYPGLADRIVFDPGVLVAAPQVTSEQGRTAEPDRTVTDAGLADAQRAVDAHVDSCARSPAVSPDGCPFDAEYSAALGGLDDFTGVTWTVRTHPRVHVDVTDRGPVAVVRTPGTVTLTGSGQRRSADGGSPTTFTATCEFGLDGVRLTITADGFEATGGAEPHRAALSTLCT